MQNDALDEIEQLFHISTNYSGGAPGLSTPPTACTVVFSLRGIPAHPIGEKPALIDNSQDPTAEIAIAAGTDCSLLHWLTFPDNFATYAPRETFAQAALEAAALNLPTAA